MSTTLCFDFGNTRKKLAVFKENTISDIVNLSDDTTSTIASIIKKYNPDKSILSSVVDHHPDIEQQLSKATRFHKLDFATKLPFTTPVSKPETIGADRLALAAAAVHFYPEKNNLVISLGTCITYNFINKYHEFVGGSISPGLEMRLKSLHDYTAKLPLVKADSNLPLIGYDTKTNILSGVILGMAKEIDGITAAYEEKFGNFNVLLTGGDIVYLASHLKKKIFADPDLIFKGLYGISEVNNP
ncbi:MAG: type III pantothenate kinase [Chitinophagaceae bacterium]|nr:type III pantothenate kinase [Chitinophagaceae bacterium]